MKIENLHAELKSWREAANITQTELGKEFRVTQAHISAIEKGQKKPSVELFFEYLKLFNRCIKKKSKKNIIKTL
jgi:DNA-binding XRE family transcriptional regulator